MTDTDDKKPDCQFDSVVVRGVKVDSRYRHLAEFNLMSEVVRLLPQDDVGMIQSIFCDSKATCVYTVRLKYGRPDGIELIKRAIGMAVHAAVLKVSKGHNGIYVEATDFDRNSFDVPPYWDEE